LYEDVPPARRGRSDGVIEDESTIAQEHRAGSDFVGGDESTIAREKDHLLYEDVAQAHRGRISFKDLLAPKDSEIPYYDMLDEYRLAAAGLPAAVNSTDDDYSSGKTIVSQVDISMKQHATSRNTIMDTRRRVARAFTPNDSTDESYSGKTIVSGLSSSALSLQRGDCYLQHFFGDDPSFMFLIFEELDTTTLHLQIRQDTENHVLHKDRREYLKAYHIIAVHPDGNQYLVRDADKHVHYGLWRPQLVMILELLQLISKIDVVVPYEGTKSHRTKFAIIRNGREATEADPGFKNFDFHYVKMATCNAIKGSRANVAESYGYASQAFEKHPDKESGCYRPSIKSNTVGNKDIGSMFISMSNSIRNMDSNGNFYNPLHPLVNDRKNKFSVRMGTATGLDCEESKRIIGEGLTIFRNTVPSELLKDKGGMKDTWEQRSLRHLELEIELFREDMPIMPHTDRKNCPHENFNILACTLKCLRLDDESVLRLGGLLYFREACSHFVSREEIGDVIEHNLENKLREMPIHLIVVNPHVPRLLQSKEGGIFPYPPHLNKCMYFSILVDRINLVSTVHKLTLPRRVELCSITLALNGMDLPWEILTRWAQSSVSLPRNNLYMAFVEAATEINNGTICSNSSFRRSQPSNNRPKSLAEVLFMNQVRRLWFLVSTID
jgi:hypothetical protein